MRVTNVIFKAFFVVGCLATLLSATEEEFAQELIDHVLRVPDPDKVLNTVLGRLERNRDGLPARSSQPAEEETDCEDPPEGPSRTLPEYTEILENSREREFRQLGPQKHYPICHLERKIRRLNTNDYEYRPAYYEEIRCIESAGVRGEKEYSNEICSSLGFSCVQWNKTIHLTRRRYTSDCWESRTMVIPAGCECMWPVHRLGDMALHI